MGVLSLRRRLVGFAAALCVLGAVESQAQEVRFEVASIRPNNSTSVERYIRPSTGRLSIRNMTVRNLLKTAYGVLDFQISGGPGWIDSESFDIEATSAGAATPKELAGPMLRMLLEERFKLRAHRVDSKFAVYVLTVVSRGSNLQPSADQVCVPSDPGNPLLPQAPGRNPGEMCGSMGLGLTSLNGKQVSMPALAMALSHLLGKTVIDETNLSGEYDMRLTFAPPGRVPNGAVFDTTLPDILTAVREQLGLKLESADRTVPILVIDHVERPSEN
jgi:uncharacterized protein (TIGR03435 family)